MRSEAAIAFVRCGDHGRGRSLPEAAPSWGCAVAACAVGKAWAGPCVFSVKREGTGSQRVDYRGGEGGQLKKQGG